MSIEHPQGIWPNVKKNRMFDLKTNSSSKCYVAINDPHGEFVDMGPAFLNNKEEEKRRKMKNRYNQLRPTWEWYLKEIKLR